jgi:putative transposase
VIKGSKRFTKGLHSLEERIGCTIVHPKEVGNSQANGICENFNVSWLDKCSRELATYQNPKIMDELTFKRVKKLTSEMVKAEKAGDLVLRDAKRKEAERMGKGLVFETFEQAIAWINTTCEVYNDQPHSSLKKITEPETGKRRHQTPREALAEHVANGWEPVAVEEDTLIDLFKPHTVCKVTRETVTPYGGMRYKNDGVLGHYNGKEVVVVYDIHDYQTVQVKDLKGELICEAQFVSATGYRPQTAYEAAEQRRGKAQLAANERKKQKIIERRPMAGPEEEGTVIEYDFGLVIPPQAPREELVRVAWEDAAPLPKVQEISVMEMMAAARSEQPIDTPEPVYADMLMWMAGLGEKPGEVDVGKEAAQ